mmetsp:Transcript_983/g.1213  ORF Transcript_983/g.1213 Transcript_983/m.1213 type:complete len:89 (+) Transcript_983:341-607(+)
MGGIVKFDDTGLPKFIWPEFITWFLPVGIWYVAVGVWYAPAMFILGPDAFCACEDAFIIFEVGLEDCGLRDEKGSSAELLGINGFCMA